MVKKTLGLLALILLGGCFSPSTPQTEVNYLENFKGDIYSTSQSLKKYGDDVQHFDTSRIYLSDSIIYLQLPYQEIELTVINKQTYGNNGVSQVLYKADSLSKSEINKTHLLVDNRNNETTISLSISDTVFFFYNCLKK
jgi:hypothetical protein